MDKHYDRKVGIISYLHNNNITSLQEYQKLVEDWILFYKTDRLNQKNSRN